MQSSTAQVPQSTAGGLSTQAQTALAGMTEQQLSHALTDEDGFQTVIYKKHHQAKNTQPPTSPPRSPKNKSGKSHKTSSPQVKNPKHLLPHPLPKPPLRKTSHKQKSLGRTFLPCILTKRSSRARPRPHMFNKYILNKEQHLHWRTFWVLPK